MSDPYTRTRIEFADSSLQLEIGDDAGITLSQGAESLIMAFDEAQEMAFCIKLINDGDLVESVSYYTSVHVLVTGTEFVVGIADRTAIKIPYETGLRVAAFIVACLYE
jgi:hypothetical protein